MHGAIRFVGVLFVVIFLLSSPQISLGFSQYTENVIGINGNEEFREWASKMNWSGDGSAENPYIIENITMKVPFQTNGIFISNTTVHFIIRNCNISFAHNDNENIISGIKLYNVANAVIENNIFYKDEMAISIYESSNVDVMHNEFYAEDEGGVYIKRSENVKISDNYFERGESFVLGRYVTNITLLNNTISYYKEGGILFEFSAHLKIIKNEIKVKRGLKYSDRPREAMWMDLSKFILIENNTIMGGKSQCYGISLESPEEAMIRGNKIMNSECYGIQVTNGKNITLDKNDISISSGEGVSFIYDVGAVVESNRITYNDFEGIGVYDSQNILIVKNLIAFNGMGIDVSGGKSIEIYNNSFFYNRGSGDKYNSSLIQAYDEDGAARWYDPSGYGNYWDDWARNNDTNDKNGDGIVDYPYKIGKGIDYYPLKYIPTNYKIEPTPPRKLRLIYGDGYLNISWRSPVGNGSSPIVGYIIYRNGKGIATLPATRLYYNDTSVMNGVKYEYYVTAFNSEKESLRSNVVRGVPGVPGKPLNLRTHSERGYIYISWEPPLNKGASDVEYYKVYRALYIFPPPCPQGPLSWVLIAVVPAAQLYYVDANVTNGVSYLYGVSAVNKYGEGPKSKEVIGRAGAIPSPPLNLTVINEGNHINITWNASRDNGGWEIFEYRVYCNGELIARIYPYRNKILYYNYTPKYPGVYVFYVTAVNAIGESDPSEMVTISYNVPNKNWGRESSGGDYIWIDLEILGMALTAIFICMVIYKKRYISKRE